MRDSQRLVGLDGGAASRLRLMRNVGPVLIVVLPFVFGIRILIVVDVGLITPPVGLTLFVIKAMAKDVATARTEPASRRSARRRHRPDDLPDDVAGDPPLMVRWLY